MSTLDYQAKRAYQRGVKWLVVMTLLTGVSLAGVALYYKLQKRIQKLLLRGYRKWNWEQLKTKLVKGEPLN